MNAKTWRRRTLAALVWGVTGIAVSAGNMRADEHCSFCQSPWVGYEAQCGGCGTCTQAAPPSRQSGAFDLLTRFLRLDDSRRGGRGQCDGGACDLQANACDTTPCDIGDYSSAGVMSSTSHGYLSPNAPSGEASESMMPSDPETNATSRSAPNGKLRHSQTGRPANGIDSDTAMPSELRSSPTRQARPPKPPVDTQPTDETQDPFRDDSAKRLDRRAPTSSNAVQQTSVRQPLRDPHSIQPVAARR